MKDKIISILFVTILIFFFLFGIFLPDKEISVSERRTLASFPEIEIESIFNGSFFEELNDYLVEHFPLRDNFRKLKGLVSTKILKKTENNGVFEEEGKIYELNATLNEKSINHILNLIKKIEENNIKESNVYYSIIPDKNYYLESDTIPKLDYKKIENTFKKELKNMTYISLFNELDLDSYYATDIHWKQESLEKVLDTLTNAMDFKTSLFPTEKETYQKFYGALYGKLASNIEPDVLTYLKDEEIESAKVYNYEKQEYQKVYEENNLKNIDSYDVYLSGATPLLIIENEKQKNGKELIIFRDSFASSLTPLLISSYEKITMIDLRYLSSNLLNDIEEIDFKKADDVLFLYSVPVINNSFTLK